MYYLYSGTGNGKFHFCNPKALNIIKGKWCLDNGCFNGEFDKNVFDAFLKRNMDKKKDCLFIVMPDKMGDACETIKLFNHYYPLYSDWPLAFVAQDGQENLNLPDSNLWECLFIGGTTDWKLGSGAKKCIEKAQELGKHVHIGRINSFRRFKYFSDLEVDKEFTCDGTKQRFVGTEKALEIYGGYETKYKKFLRGNVPTCSYNG